MKIIRYVVSEVTQLAIVEHNRRHMLMDVSLGMAWKPLCIIDPSKIPDGKQGDTVVMATVFTAVLEL